jgi:glycosyltransferase involved in cell wall biosynthesis
VDTLESGGLERVAVNIANALPRDRYRSYLGTTRRDGPLAALVADHVVRLKLARRSRFDVRGIRRLVSFVRSNDIAILHAHGSSLFVAAVASLVQAPRPPALIWHDHYGQYLCDDRPRWVYRLASRRVNGVISVNRPLAAWAKRHLCVPPAHVWYIPNFVCPPAPDQAVNTTLPGQGGRRIVCVANLRPQKDHESLFRAMAIVTRTHPDAHLLLVGSGGDPAYVTYLRDRALRLGVAGQISFLGHRDDVGAILESSDVGVLSSSSEGFPLALAEYGWAGLAAVSTDVGECRDVLDGGAAGVLVAPGDPDVLAAALVSLLQAPMRRRELGARLKERVRTVYAAERIVEQICEVYRIVAADSRGTAQVAGPVNSSVSPFANPSDGR